MMVFPELMRNRLSSSCLEVYSALSFPLCEASSFMTPTLSPGVPHLVPRLTHSSCPACLPEVG